MTQKKARAFLTFALLCLTACNRNEDNDGAAVHEESLPAVTPEGTPPMPDRLDTLMHDTAVTSVSSTPAS